MSHSEVLTRRFVEPRGETQSRIAPTSVRQTRKSMISVRGRECPEKRVGRGTRGRNREHGRKQDGAEDREDDAANREEQLHGTDTELGGKKERYERPCMRGGEAHRRSM